MIIKNVSLDIVCGITSKLPSTGRPEVAFAGKSNVGKSSLINALMNRKSLARTSAAPGKTQTINFYNVNEAIYLVDLPGYGYAKASEEIKAKWGKMIEDYVANREQLKEVFMLIDFRHKPSSDDILMYKYLKYYNLKVTVVATKIDKISFGQREKYKNIILNTLELQEGDKLVLFSSVTKDGKKEIYGEIEKYLDFIDE